MRRDELRFRRAQGLVGVASSSATHEARAGQKAQCALIARKAQGDGAVRVEPWRRARANWRITRSVDSHARLVGQFIVRSGNNRE